MVKSISVRDVLIVNFPKQSPSGCEQQGRRPAVVITLPRLTGVIRYQVIVVAPMTTKSGDWVIQNPSLYPCLAAGVANLPLDSIVLLDQLRCLDIKRILAYQGTLTPEEYQPIADGLKVMLRL
ncbi:MULTISPECIES: type II toxin-antitoxin system PemK/MazF family toxin [Kamptonema]|uniref:type II toxin-antitoxin system PemK/MazF family toxin n=1 Tax=Kamptonema TaxID=1501433 RepID=UPI000477AECE|nr:MULTISPECIES: type II toxin-antitoxin system PemK/MazF family toxin [Kamptonema]